MLAITASRPTLPAHQLVLLLLPNPNRRRARTPYVPEACVLCAVWWICGGLQTAHYWYFRKFLLVCLRSLQLIVFSYLDYLFRLLSIGYEPPLYFLMCHAQRLLLWHVLFWLGALIIVSLSPTIQRPFVTLSVFSRVQTKMPVTTRSMTKGGLQDITSSAPPLSLRPTCSNAIFNNSESSVYINSPSPEEQLPEWSLPLNATSSSSDYVSDSSSSLDLDFENSKFETF